MWLAGHKCTTIKVSGQSRINPTVVTDREGDMLAYCVSCTVTAAAQSTNGWDRSVQYDDDRRAYRERTVISYRTLMSNTFLLLQRKNNRKRLQQNQYSLSRQNANSDYSGSMTQDDAPLLILAPFNVIISLYSVKSAQ